jgi:hypothetical protein
MSHPDHCRGCRGASYRPGPPIIGHAYGRPHTYVTVKPCEHPHWQEDPDWREFLARDNPKAVDAQQRGHVIGRHELWLLSGGQLGAQHPNHQPAPTEEF